MVILPTLTALGDNRATGRSLTNRSVTKGKHFPVSMESVRVIKKRRAFKKDTPF
jgi:hypothetical protein